MTLIDRLTAIGDALRAKTGRKDLIPLVDMPSVIASISTGEVKTGEFTINTGKNEATPTITLGCGFTPSVLIVYPIDTYATAGDQMIVGCIISAFNQFKEMPIEVQRSASCVLELQDNILSWQHASTQGGQLTNDTVKLCYRSGNYLWRDNFKYGWLAIA